MPYLLDTNILVHIIRQSDVWEFIKKEYFPKGLKGQIVISAVTVGEIRSFAVKNGWGKIRTRRLLYLINNIKVERIVPPRIQDMYVNIDTYSQNRHKSLRLPKKYGARNMGKNDIWIAATAAALELPLMSTDKDFEHLHDVFIDFLYINVEEILKN